MSAFTKYQCFVQDLGRKVHNLNADTLKVALTNTAPNVATHAVLADITEIAAGNGYSAGGGTVGSNTWIQTAGTAALAGNDVVFTATGAVGPFRYAVLYNATASGGPLIGYWDYTLSQSLNFSGETFTVDVANAGIITES